MTDILSRIEEARKTAADDGRTDQRGAAYRSHEEAEFRRWELEKRAALGQDVQSWPEEDRKEFDLRYAAMNASRRAHDTLKKPIKTVQDAKAFIQHLVDTDRMFHFDDDIHDISWAPDAPTSEELALMDERRNELFQPAFDWGDDVCPFGFAIRADEEANRPKAG